MKLLLLKSERWSWRICLGLIVGLAFGVASGHAQAVDSNLADFAALVASRTREALLFRNGDLLYGKLESIHPGTGIRWQHAEADKVIEFQPDNIAEIHFPPHPRPALTNQANAFRLQLRNGDQLEGQVIGFDQEKVVLQTWYAGEMTFPKGAVRALIPVPPAGALVFQGPTGMEGWTIGKVSPTVGEAGSWQYKNGAFYATNAASIARDLKLPDVSLIEFDLAWKGMFQLAVAIYTDYLQPINLANKETEPDFGDFYSLQLNSFSANLLPIKKNDPLRYLGQVSVPSFSQKNAAHIEIRASKLKRTVALFVDGQLIKQWVDNEEFSGQGTGVRFVHQPQGKLKLSNLRVWEWDGQFEEKTPLISENKQDLAKLRNGDRVSGVVQSVDNGHMQIVVGENKLDVPLSRVRQIDLATPVTPLAAIKNDFRAFFSRGGAVTFKLEKWEDGKIFGRSPNFGELAFDSSAFSKVELRLRSAP
jgi:sRNA-binding regulator protein Hfq